MCMCVCGHTHAHTLNFIFPTQKKDYDYKQGYKIVLTMYFATLFFTLVPLQRFPAPPAKVHNYMGSHTVKF